MYLFRHHLICHRAAHDVRLNEHNVCVFTSCARRWNCGLSKCWYWSRILFCRARAPQLLPGNFLNFPFTIILQNILFWWASHSQIILKFSLLCDIEMLLFLFFFFIFISLSVYFLRQILIWPGSEFTGTFQCHPLQSLKIISYSAPFSNSKWTNRVPK